MTLNTHDLRALMMGDPQFFGVYALDRLPHGVNRHATIKMIVNLDPASQPGSHWIAIYRRHGRAYYFDTFGHHPPKLIRDWLARNSTRYQHHTRTIQSPQDRTSCGYLCLAFLQGL